MAQHRGDVLRQRGRDRSPLVADVARGRIRPDHPDTSDARVDVSLVETAGWRVPLRGEHNRTLR